MVASVTGCDSPTEPRGTGGAAGNPLTVQAALYTAEGDGYEPIAPGGALELWAAPQGGRWARIGARVGGLDSDTAELVARLIEPVTGALVAEASRTAPMIVTPDDPDFKHPEPSDMNHVVHLPLCPDGNGRAVHGVGYLLELQVTELYGDFSTGSVALPVVPGCQEVPGPARDYCECECGPDYVLGKCVWPEG